MPIDKGNAPVVKASIHTTYAPVLERTLITFILRDLAEIMDSMILRCGSGLNPHQRKQARDEALRSSQVKSSLLARLNSLKHMRHEICAEVIQQYSLKLPNDEISFYYDVMEELLQTYEKRIEACITGAAYDLLHQRFNELTS